MSDAGGVRIGDAERQAVIDLLRRHTGEGRLTLDEFAERAGEVYAAVTREDIDAILADLPQGVRPERPVAAPQPAPAPAEPPPSREQAAGVPAPQPAPAPARRGGTPRRRFIAIMSGSEAKGAWRAPESVSAFAFWGGVDIDLRNALIESSVVEIEAWAIMGGVTVTVPPGIPVDVDGFILMGGITNKVRGDEPLIPGAPLIRVKARGMWGGVTVRNPSRRAAARRAREQARREARERRHELRHEMHQHRHDIRRQVQQSAVDPRSMAEEALDLARSAIDRALPPPRQDDRIPDMPGDRREPVARTEPGAGTDAAAGPGANEQQNAANRAANAAQNAAPGAAAPGAPAPPRPPPVPPVPATPAPPTPPDPSGSDPGLDADAAPDTSAAAPPKIPTGTLTIMVSDIVGSTQMAERLGDQSWLDVLQKHNAIVRLQVGQHGGTEVKAQGDGFLVVFPSARQAVLAAIAIQRDMARYDHDHLGGHPVAVRVGLHTGEVVAVDGDVFGQNVVVASRIAALSEPGEIFVSGLTHDLTSSASDLGFEPGKEVDLKGMSAPWRVHRVIWS